TMRLSVAILLLACLPVGAVPLNDDPEAKAVAEIKSLGGRIRWDDKLPGTPVVEVDLSDTGVMDAALAHLKRLKHLRIVDLRGTATTDRRLANLKALTRLQILNLTRTNITDAGLARL